MRHGTSSRRQRNRNNGRRNNQQRSQVYDSNGPDVRIRGTAHQVAEKYLTLAKDATSAGDRIVAENYYQHAEHYIRIINEYNGSFDASKMPGGKPDHVEEDEGNQKQNAKPSSKQSKAKSKESDELGLPPSVTAEKSEAKENSKQNAEAVD